MKAIARGAVIRALGLFLGILALGAWPWPGVAVGFSAVYCPMANLVLVGHTFGDRGHARLIAVREIRRKESDQVTADAVLSLAVAGYSGTLPLGVSLRRDVYLPLLILMALIVSFPLPPVRRLICLGVGVPTTLAAGIAANGLVVAWTFMTQLKGIYPAAPAMTKITELAYGAILLPPGNRFIAPIALGAALLAWQALRSPSQPTTVAQEVRRVQRFNDRLTSDACILQSDAMAQDDRFAAVLSQVAREVTHRQTSKVCCGDLTLEQFQTLQAVARVDRASIGSLSAELRVDLSTMSRNITVLERNGSVARVRSDEDSRVVHVRLLARGKRALETLRCSQRDVLSAVYDRLPSRERSGVLKALETLRDYLIEPHADDSECCPRTDGKRPA
jgi:DNA-binding MarR family transcriptional regulator